MSMYLSVSLSVCVCIGVRTYGRIWRTTLNREPHRAFADLGVEEIATRIMRDIVSLLLALTP